MDIKKQPKPWYIRYRYPILSGAAGIAILVYALFLIVTSTRRHPDSVVIAEVKNTSFLGVCRCRRTGATLQDHPGECDGERIRGTGGGRRMSHAAAGRYHPGASESGTLSFY